jgi:hypothetical protein
MPIKEARWIERRITHQIHHSRVESDLARLPQTFLGRCQSPKFLLNVGAVVQGPFAAFVLEGVKVSVDQDFGFRGPYSSRSSKSEDV